MERTHHINGFGDLIAYFKQTHVTFTQIEQITNQGLKLYFVEEHSKERAIELLIKFWDKWKNHNEKPLFIMLDN